MQETQKNNQRNQNRSRFWGYFVVILILLSLASVAIANVVVNNQRTHKAYLLQSKANDIRDKMDMLAARVHVMRFMVMAEDGDPDSFYELAPYVLEGWDDTTRDIVRNVALAPEGVVQYVYPMEGNEPLIGYDLWKAAAPSAAATETLQKGHVNITPPIDLVQGGRGMNFSLPVTLPGEDESWGIVSMVVDTDRLIASFLLKDFAAHQAEYDLSFRNMNGEYETLVTSGEVVTPVYIEFGTESLNWRLSVTGTLDSSGRFFLALLLLGVLVISVLLAFSMTSRKQRKEMNEMLRELAGTDSVTGCATRHFVYEKLVDRESGKWRLDGMDYSLVILDVDHFKTVNDTWGHEVGDEVLRKIAELILRSLAKDKGDCAIRFGGDEFVMLFSRRTEAQLRDIMNHVQNQVRQMRLESRPDLQVTVSMGGVYMTAGAEDVPTYAELLRAADEKLYQAKDAGRNRYVL